MIGVYQIRAQLGLTALTVSYCLGFDLKYSKEKLTILNGSKVSDFFMITRYGLRNNLVEIAD
jgi:hypothetical protein